jgi:hypothetical protein
MSPAAQYWQHLLIKIFLDSIFYNSNYWHKIFESPLLNQGDYMKRILHLFTLLVIVCCALIFCGCSGLYIPASSLGPRPVFVYGPQKERSVAFGYRHPQVFNHGEDAALSTFSYRIGGRRSIFQGFLGGSAYAGYYKVGAINSVFENKSVYGMSPELEGNLVIPIENVSFGVGMYGRYFVEGGEYNEFRNYYRAHPDTDDDGNVDVEVIDVSYLDIHAIINVHHTLDYTFLIGKGIYWHDAYVGLGVSSKRWGGWLTLTPGILSDVYPSESFSTKNRFYCDLGISYRLSK